MDFFNNIIELGIVESVEQLEFTITGFPVLLVFFCILYSIISITSSTFLKIFSR